MEDASMSRNRTFFVIVGVTAAAALGGTAVASTARGGGTPLGIPAGVSRPTGPAISASCGPLGKVEYAVATVSESTESADYVDVPNMSVTFTQGGTATRCAIVNYSAFVFAAEGDNLMYVRALLDGVTEGSPAEYQFSGDDDEEGDGRWARTHAAIFVFPSVSPGLHRITIQWRSFDGQHITTHSRAMTVTHR
jgi:hypothetical protein